MFQPFLPGLEGTVPFEVAHKSIYDIEKTISFFESRGFESRGFMDGSTYVPEKILIPSGFSIDPNLLSRELKRERREEIIDAYYYYLAIRSKYVGMFSLNQDDNLSWKDFFEDWDLDYNNP